MVPRSGGPDTPGSGYAVERASPPGGSQPQPTALVNHARSAEMNCRWRRCSRASRAAGSSRPAGRRRDQEERCSSTASTRPPLREHGRAGRGAVSRTAPAVGTSDRRHAAQRHAAIDGAGWRHDGRDTLSVPRPRPAGHRGSRGAGAPSRTRSVARPRAWPSDTLTGGRVRRLARPAAPRPPPPALAARPGRPRAAPVPRRRLRPVAAVAWRTHRPPPAGAGKGAGSVVNRCGVGCSAGGRRAVGPPKGGVTGQLSQCHDLSPRRRMPAGVKTAGIHRT